MINRAIQIYSGAGLSQDRFLTEAYTYARFMRIGDGSDQVLLSALGKQLLKGALPACCIKEVVRRSVSPT